MKWTDLFLERNLISRVAYFTPGPYQVISPPRAAIIRVSMVGGGGGVGPNGFGQGAAFARYLGGCGAEEAFTLQVGERALNTAAGDSHLTRNVGAVLLCKADRGRPDVPGSEANSVGTTKRAGALGMRLGAQVRGGQAGSDAADAFSLGFLGRGARSAARGQEYLAPYAGGGGVAFLAYQSGGYNIPWSIAAGPGKAIVEFFDQHPGAEYA